MKWCQQMLSSSTKTPSPKSLTNNRFFGNGADKCRDTLKHPNAHFIEGIVPKASNMLPLAERALALNETEDVAYYEPFYLKQFVAGKSKNLLNG